jgi:hypothetical protein
MMTDHIKDAFEEFKNNFDKLNNLFQKEVAQNPSLKVHNPCHHYLKLLFYVILFLCPFINL